ncbi:helix-turn-helix domain-containing protein [Elusimicrobiota bacterium]
MTQFTSLTGLSRNVVASLERDETKHPRRWVLAKIAAAFQDKAKDSFPDLQKILNIEVPAETFGSRLRDLRRSRSMKPGQLARQIGIGRTTLYRYEEDIYKPNKFVMERLNQIFKDKSLKIPVKDSEEAKCGE